VEEIREMIKTGKFGRNNRRIDLMTTWFSLIFYMRIFPWNKNPSRLLPHLSAR